jgi:sodium/potassium-transporting ATPase subunit beta
MVIFLQTVPLDEPKWQTSNSLIGESPGLGLRPKNSEDLIDSAIIMFNTKSKAARTPKEKLTDKVASYQEWTARITKFLKVYKNETENNKRLDCSQTKVTSKHGCKFDVVQLENQCGEGGKLDEDGNSQFGYDKGSPCVFLKLNRIFGLENTPYNASDLPEAMPKELKKHIKEQSDQNQVWVNCQGKYPADKEMLQGKDAITYFPKSKGFPSNYFPYRNQEDYLSPLVAVKFNPLKNKATGFGQLIHIECRAWAQNIGYDRRDKIGISVFELHIMDQDATDKYNGKTVAEKE